MCCSDTILYVLQACQTCSHLRAFACSLCLLVTFFSDLWLFFIVIQVSAQMSSLCPPHVPLSLTLFSFPSQHFLKLIFLYMFIAFPPMRTGTRPIVYKSINIWRMIFISQFPYSNRAFRVDTAKLQTRYQDLQRLVHPDFFSQRSQVACWPPLIVQNTSLQGMGGSGLVARWLSETELNNQLHPGAAWPQLARLWTFPALTAFTWLPRRIRTH